MAERENKLVWGEGEDLSDFLRKVDAYRLSVGDEKKAVGKALLGLGSRIGVMDSFAEDDTKDINSLKAALQREFGRTPRWFNDAFRDRSKLHSETYGMYLAALQQLCKGAFPGTDLKSPVAAALLKSRFLDGIASSVASQLRLSYPDAAVDKLPDHAKRVEEALSTSATGAEARVRAVGDRSDEGSASDPIAQLRAEVAELTQAVNAIRAGNGPPQPRREAAAAGGAGVTSQAPGAGKVAAGRVSCWACGGEGHVQRDCGRMAAGPSIGMSRQPYAGRRLKCWTCGEPGHIQRECQRSPVGRGRGGPAQVVCWGCGHFGHTRYNCPIALN